MFIVLLTALIFLMSEIDFLLNFKKSIRNLLFIQKFSKHENKIVKKGLRKRKIYSFEINKLIVYIFLISVNAITFIISSFIVFNNKYIILGLCILLFLNILRTIIFRLSLSLSLLKILSIIETSYNILFLSLLIYFILFL